MSSQEIEEIVGWLDGVLTAVEQSAQGAAAAGLHAAPILNSVNAHREIVGWALVWLGRGCAPWNADAIRILASAYATMPGYKEEWRPR